MTRFSAKEYMNKWEIWEHIDGSRRQVCVMTSSDILQLFNETVPNTVEELFLVGDPSCKHAWRPWKFNNNFVRCSFCPAMKKIKKLVPKEYKE